MGQVEPRVCESLSQLSPQLSLHLYLPPRGSWNRSIAGGPSWQHIAPLFPMLAICGSAPPSNLTVQLTGNRFAALSPARASAQVNGGRSFSDERALQSLQILAFIHAAMNSTVPTPAAWQEVRDHLAMPQHTVRSPPVGALLAAPSLCTRVCSVHCSSQCGLVRAGRTHNRTHHRTHHRRPWTS
jgi:hypothetical protein